MIFSRLENIELEKRTSHRVGFSDFISLNPLNTFFPLCSVSEVLIEFNLSNPTLDFSEPCSESAQPYAESAEPYAESTELYVKSAEPYIKSTLSYEESAQPYAKSTQPYAKSAEAYAESTQPYVNLYNAAGQKVMKKVHDLTSSPSGTIKQVDYLDGFQYAGEVLQFFPHAEGYVSATPGQSNVTGTFTSYIFNYVYNYTDHLGNIRVSYSKDPVNNQLKIMEQNHYYPFGLKHQVYAASKMEFELVEGMEELARPTFVSKTDYQYKYNGKEWQDELGLNMYDYGFRNYDPALGRWLSPDPLSEEYLSWSPYNYALNNPVYFLDPNGLWVDDYLVDNNGNVSLIQETDDPYDVLYTEDQVVKNPNSQPYNDEPTHIVKEGEEGYQVNDQSILPQLVDKGSPFRGDIHYAVNGGYSEMKNLFVFMAENTKVEWSLSQYGNDYALATLHKSVRAPVMHYYFPEQFSLKDMKFHIHNHEDTNGPSDSRNHSYRQSDDYSFSIHHNNALKKQGITKYHIYSVYYEPTKSLINYSGNKRETTGTISNWGKK